MGVRITLGRVVAFIVLCALASVGLTIALTRGDSSDSKRRTRTLAPPTKIVPGVVGQPYVFAESSLQQEGFGWKVAGPVAGWAGVIVSSQSPLPGTRVVDTGAPLVTLRLTKPKDYITQGTPENSSPYKGTKIVLPTDLTGTGQSTTSARTTTTSTFSITSGKTTTKTMPTTTKTTPAQTRPPAFKIAGSMAIKSASRKALPVLLEPVMSIEVVVPEDYMGDVIGDLNSRRGRIEGMELRGTTQIIKSMVPLAQMFGYATELRSRTQGRGSFTMHFGKYEEVPGALAEEIVSKVQGKTTR